jgi:hypothetical protein
LEHKFQSGCWLIAGIPDRRPFEANYSDDRNTDQGSCDPGMLILNGKEEPRMSPHAIQAIAGAFAVAVLGIIVYRRKQKNA